MRTTRPTDTLQEREKEEKREKKSDAMWEQAWCMWWGNSIFAVPIKRGLKREREKKRGIKLREELKKREKEKNPSALLRANDTGMDAEWHCA